MDDGEARGQGREHPDEPIRPSGTFRPLIDEDTWFPGPRLERSTVRTSMATPDPNEIPDEDGLMPGETYDRFPGHPEHTRPDDAVSGGSGLFRWYSTGGTGPGVFLPPPSPYDAAEYVAPPTRVGDDAYWLGADFYDYFDGSAPDDQWYRRLADSLRKPAEGEG